MSAKPSARRHRQEGEAEVLDLDVTPFLNVMFMLILSTLALTAWTQLAMLNVQAPEIGGADNAGANGSETPPTSQLNLTIFVLKNGFNIGATGTTLTGVQDDPPRAGTEPYVPQIQVTQAGKTTVEYDFARLQKRLIEIKKNFPAEGSLIISADGDVPYDVIVKTMDTSRKSADGKLLFPMVAFAAGVVG